MSAAEICDEDIVYPFDATVEGSTMGEWAARWWQWIGSIPSPQNPMLNSNNGSNCGIDQEGPVFFLAATLGGTSDVVLRDKCMVPCGKKIFFPIFPVLCWAPGDCDPNQMPVCRACSKGFVDPVSGLLLEIDGRGIRCLEDHRHTSPEFDFTMPPVNIFGIEPPLTRKGVADGYWIMLEPLPPGKHTIHFKATHATFQTEDITYEITVDDRCGGSCDEDVVYPFDATVEGLTMGEWAARWWQWVGAIPTPENPMLNSNNGANCGIDQEGPVFFIVATPGGTSDVVLRDKCMVPCGKKIFFPIFPVLCWAPGDCDPNQMQVCRACAKGFVDPVFGLLLEIDGRGIRCLEDHRHTSPEFDFTMPVVNLFGIEPPLTRKGTADGYWIMLEPLSPGKHTIHFKATHATFQTEDITYEITVADCGGQVFRRGDGDASGAIDLTDAIRLLKYLFLGEAKLECMDAADFDDNGLLDLGDAVSCLEFQYLGGREPAPPYPACGEDPIPETPELGCATSCK